MSTVSRNSGGGLKSVVFCAVVLMVLLTGCGVTGSKDQEVVDSIFASYHNSSTAFDKDDVATLMRYADSSGSHYGKVLAHLDMASLCATKAQQSEAIYHLDQVSVAPDDPPFALAYADFVHGLVHQYNTDFIKALFYYNRAAEAFAQLDRRQALATVYTNMSEIYADFEAWDMHQRYKKLARESLTDSMIVGYNVMSDSIYSLIHQGQLSLAHEVWLRYDRLFDQERAFCKFQFAFVYNHYDQAQTIHFGLGDYDSALYYNNALVLIVGENKESSQYADLMLSQAQICLAKGDGAGALVLCKELLAGAERGAVPLDIAIDVYPTLLECYGSLHEWKQGNEVALEYGRKLNAYNLQIQRNSMLQDQIEQRYEQILTQYKQERHVMQNRLLIVAIVSLVIIMSLMAIVMYKQHRQHVEQSLRLKSEQELDSTQHQLAESQMRQAKIQEQILTYTEQMRELAADMPKRLKAKTFLNLEQIKQQRDADAWRSFEEAFEREHGDFKRRLMDDYPQLNATDVKICMLMRTGMPSKDIANMLHLTPESLRTFRYNIRKKLGLQAKGVTLEDFVKGDV